MKTWAMGISMVSAMAMMATAAEEVLWADNFAGSDGTIVAPSVAWYYTNLGVEIEWQVIPRLDAQDQYYISNNQLYCYVGPCTNDPNVYNKVMAAFNPLSSGSPVYLMLTNGQIEASFDLKEINANNGGRWGLNQELKLSLSAAPVWADPHPSVTNMYTLKVIVRPGTGVGASNVLVQGMIMVTNKQVSLPQTIIASNYVDAAIPLKMIVRGDSTFVILTNNAVQAMTNGIMPDGAVNKVYPFFWHGKFTRENGVVADGNMFIDNFVVKYIPEPVAITVLLLGMAGLCCRAARRG
jgi:hypothetical protein